MQRLKLKPQKIKQLAEGLRAIAKQDEPIRRVGGAHLNATLMTITLQFDALAYGARALCCTLSVLVMHKWIWEVHEAEMTILARSRTVW